MVDRESRPWFAVKQPLAGCDEEVVRPAENRTSVLVIGARQPGARKLPSSRSGPRGGGTHTAVVIFERVFDFKFCCLSVL